MLTLSETGLCYLCVREGEKCNLSPSVPIPSDNLQNQGLLFFLDEAMGGCLNQHQATETNTKPIVSKLLSLQTKKIENCECEVCHPGGRREKE